MSSTFVRPIRPRPIEGQLAMLSVSRLAGVTTINIGTPSDKVVRVVCVGGVTLQIFDLASKPLYTIIPSILMLNNDYIFSVLKGIEKKVRTESGKNPKAVELYFLLCGIRRLIYPENLAMADLTTYHSFDSTINSYGQFDENCYAIKSFNKKQIRFFPDLLHSMQISDDEPVFELCKGDESSFADLTEAMFSFSKLSLSDDISEIVSLVAQFLKVRKGFTCDTRETPIPNSSKGANGGVNLQTCYLSKLGFVPNDIIDLLGLTMFRHIGLCLPREKLIILFTEMIYSKIPLNEGVKEVLEELLSRDFVAYDQVKLYSQPTCLSMWQTSKLVPNIPDIKFTHGEIAAFIFLFQTWCLDSKQTKIPFEKMAELFGFNLEFLHKKSLEVLNESIKSSKTGFTFKKWLSLVNSTWSKKMSPLGLIIVQRKKVELPIVFNGLYKAVFEPMQEKHTQKFDKLVDFMKSKSIEFKECICCNNIYLSDLVKDFMPSCETCKSSHMCMSCYNKIYSETPVEGRVLNMSSVSCICCRTIFPSMTERFPEGMSKEDIVSHSNEFYSCCVHSCRNFVHVQEEGVGCADRPDIVEDTFCATHHYMNSSIMREMCKECPGCHAMVIKSDGCNHMTCSCRAEFCMCKDCPYVKSDGEVYSHPFYCRYGISDRETWMVLWSIIMDLRSSDYKSVIPRELIQSIFMRMQQIVYQGIETPLRAALWDLSDYMNSGISDADFLTRIIHNIESRLDVDFPISIS